MKKVLILFFLILSPFLMWDFLFQNTKESTSTKLISKNKGIIYFCQGRLIINGEEKSCESVLKSSVYQKDRIKTKNRSLLKIKMIDDTSLTIGPNSYVKIKEYTVKTKNNKNILIDLMKGFLHINVKNKVLSGKAEVRTRSAVMGVRGTEFTTEYKNGKTEVYLFHGLVHVSEKTNRSKSFFLNAEESVIIRDYSFEENKVNKVKRKWVKEKEKEFSRETYVPNFKNFYDNALKVTETKRSNRKPSSVSSLYSSRKIKTTKVEKIFKEKKAIDDILKTRKRLNKKNKKEYSKKIENFLNNKYSNSKARLDLNLDNSIESEILKKEIRKYSKEKIAEQKSKINILNKKDIALPLIKPNGEIVFFDNLKEDNNKELTKNLIRNKNGDIIGIKVDEYLNPVGEKVIDEEILEDFKENQNNIKIINEYGEIEEISSVDQNNNKIINIPNINAPKRNDNDPKKFNILGETMSQLNTNYQGDKEKIEDIQESIEDHKNK